MAIRKPRKIGQLEAIRTLSDVFQRAGISLRAGMTFGGERDLYSALGYKRELTPEDHRDRYSRGGLASAIVEAYPLATWRSGAELVEDQDPTIETELEKSWAELETRLRLWPIFCRTDILAGLGRYAVLLIGVPGKLSSPVTKLNNVDQLMYVTPYGEDEVTVDEVEIDPANERFGMPKMYKLKRDTTAVKGGISRQVHWTRVIHFADGVLDDQVYGQPRLDKVWNYLDDLDKVVGGGSEAFWLRVHQGYHFSVDADAVITPDELKTMKDEAEKFAQGMRRTMAMRGTKLDVLGTDVSNFGNQVQSLVSLISGSTRIPQRILLGSERGELASTQDTATWNTRVADRRSNVVEPFVVRPFIKRMMDWGVLPQGTYTIRWPQIEDLGEEPRATIAEHWAGLNTRAGGLVVLPEEIRDHVLRLQKLPPGAKLPETPVLPGNAPADGSKPQPPSGGAP